MENLWKINAGEAVQVVVRKVKFCFSSLLADLNLRLHARNLDIARNW